MPMGIERQRRCWIHPPGVDATEQTDVDSENAIYLGRPERAIGPSDMEGCGLNNEGTAWEPMSGGAPRWLLLGFARPVYASAVAIYESNAYGTVRELLLLDEAGGYHALLDQSQGDIDNADCLHTPLVVSFPHATSHHCAVASCAWSSIRQCFGRDVASSTRPCRSD